MVSAESVFSQRRGSSARVFTFQRSASKNTLRPKDSGRYVLALALLCRYELPLTVCADGEEDGILSRRTTSLHSLAFIRTQRGRYPTYGGDGERAKES